MIIQDGFTYDEALYVHIKKFNSQKLINTMLVKALASFSKE